MEVYGYCYFGLFHMANQDGDEVTFRSSSANIVANHMISFGSQAQLHGKSYPILH